MRVGFTQTSALPLTQSLFACFIIVKTSTSSNPFPTLEKIIFDFHYWIKMAWTKYYLLKKLMPWTYIACMCFSAFLCLCRQPLRMVTPLFASCLFLPVLKRMSGGYPKKIKAIKLQRRTQSNSFSLFFLKFNKHCRTQTQD